MANLKYFLWLTTRRGFSAGDVSRVVSCFGSPEGAFFAQKEEYAATGLSDNKLQALGDKDLSGAEKILEDCERLGIHIMTIQDADYPESLAQIYDPPQVLYWKGRGLSVDDKLAIGVVGTRSCTPYGEEQAGRLGLELARSGAVVVSGMAQGIDTAALKGALQGGGSVVSVLGGGIDVVYPRDHRWLYDDVAAAGALVSEYPPGTEHAGHHFPVRNRIISGLSMGVTVVEAGEPSGALITARLALEQNREVFAFPGPAQANASLGANRLIQRGEARLILSAADIIKEFAPLFPGRVAAVEPLETEDAQARLEGERSAAPAAKEVDKTPRRGYISLSDDPERFPDDQRDVLLATQKRSLTVDEVVEATQIPARRVSSALTLLQLQGLVEERPGKRFFASVILTP